MRSWIVIETARNRLMNAVFVAAKAWPKELVIVMAMLSTIAVSAEETDLRVPDWVSRLTIAAASPMVLWMLGPMF